MTVRWTVRAATDRGPQSESLVLFEAPTKGIIQSDGSFFVTQYMILSCETVTLTALCSC